eukprot:ANDGO_00628.mRNA.1 hypothetical protein SAMD00019534_102030
MPHELENEVSTPTYAPIVFKDLTPSETALVSPYALHWKYQLQKKFNRLVMQVQTPSFAPMPDVSVSMNDLPPVVGSVLPTRQGFLNVSQHERLKKISLRLVRCDIDAGVARLLVFRGSTKTQKSPASKTEPPKLVFELKYCKVSSWTVPLDYRKKYPNDEALVVEMLQPAVEKIVLIFPSLAEKRSWFRTLSSHCFGDVLHDKNYLTSFSLDSQCFPSISLDSLLAPSSTKFSIPPRYRSVSLAPETLSFRDFHEEFWGVFDKDPLLSGPSRILELAGVYCDFVSRCRQTAEMIVSALLKIRGTGPVTYEAVKDRLASAVPPSLAIIASPDFVDVFDSIGHIVLRHYFGYAGEVDEPFLLQYRDHIMHKMLGIEMNAHSNFVAQLQPGSQLRTPVVCCVDYISHRFMCTAVPPFDSGSLLKFGCLSSGAFVSQAEPRRLLRDTCKKLRLARHQVSVGTGRHVTLRSSRHTLVYAGNDSHAYVVHLGVCRPVDASASNLVDYGDPAVQNKASVTRTRVLRFEFLQNCGISLSPDAFEDVGDTADRSMHVEECRRAASHLMDVVIPTFVRSIEESSSLLRFGFSGYRFCHDSRFAHGSLLDLIDGTELVRRMHAAGINVRHLGKVAQVCTCRYLRELCHVEMIARTVKIIWSSMIRSLLPGVPPSAEVLRLLNLVFGGSADSRQFWLNTLLPAVERKFYYPTTAIRRDYYARMPLLHAINLHIGVQLADDSAIEFGSILPFHASLCSAVQFVSTSKMLDLSADLPALSSFASTYNENDLIPLVASRIYFARSVNGYYSIEMVKVLIESALHLHALQETSAQTQGLELQSMRCALGILTMMKESGSPMFVHCLGILVRLNVGSGRSAVVPWFRKISDSNLWLGRASHPSIVTYAISALEVADKFDASFLFRRALEIVTEHYAIAASITDRLCVAFLKRTFLTSCKRRQYGTAIVRYLYSRMSVLREHHADYVMRGAFLDEHWVEDLQIMAFFFSAISKPLDSLWCLERAAYIAKSRNGPFSSVHIELLHRSLTAAIESRNSGRELMVRNELIALFQDLYCFIQQRIERLRQMNEAGVIGIHNTLDCDSDEESLLSPAARTAFLPQQVPALFARPAERFAEQYWGLHPDLDVFRGSQTASSSDQSTDAAGGRMSELEEGARRVRSFLMLHLRKAVAAKRVLLPPELARIAEIDCATHRSVPDALSLQESLLQTFIQPGKSAFISDLLENFLTEALHLMNDVNVFRRINQQKLSDVLDAATVLLRFSEGV